MKHVGVTILVAVLLVVAGGDARGQKASRDDGYCDYIKGVAASESALLFSPELFSSFGYLDQLSAVDTPGAGSDDLRFTLGVSYRLSGLYQSRLVRKRAAADCKRYRAQTAMEGSTAHRALSARADVLAEAMAEADEILLRAVADFESRRNTRQELIATRMRVDRLRDLHAATRRQLDALPPPVSGGTMREAMARYYAADNDLFEQEAALRQARSWDLSVRVGYDKFLANDDSSPYFAVVTASFNLGRLLQGSADRRASQARRKVVRDPRGMGGADATRARLRSLLRIDAKRAEESSALVDDLEAQLKALKRVGGESGRRLRQTLWFDWVEAKAELEYLTNHVASLRQVLGDEGER